MEKKRSVGVTLIELLIVMIIITILATVIYVTMSNVMDSYDEGDLIEEPDSELTKPDMIDETSKPVIKEEKKLEQDEDGEERNEEPTMPKPDSKTERLEKITDQSKKDMELKERDRGTREIKSIPGER